MTKIGFDNETYLQLQSKKILERVDRFGGKLYLEFGGKLFDDYHASRVLPGFEPDGKMKMLLQLKDQAEIVIAICAGHIEQNKRRGDLGITYDMDVMRLIDAFRSIGLYVGSVVITQYAGQHAADLFQHKLEDLGVKVYKHYPIEDYPSNVGLIVSDDGFGKNDGYGKNDGFAKYEKKSKRRNYDDDSTFQESGKKDDWKQFFQHNDNVKLKGTEPDFTEEGWARRKPRKK